MFVATSFLVKGSQEYFSWAWEKSATKAELLTNAALKRFCFCFVISAFSLDTSETNAQFDCHDKGIRDGGGLCAVQDQDSQIEASWFHMGATLLHYLEH